MRHVFQIRLGVWRLQDDAAQRDAHHLPVQPPHQLRRAGPDPAAQGTGDAGIGKPDITPRVMLSQVVGPGG